MATHMNGPLALGAGSVRVISAAVTLSAVDDNGMTCILNAAAGVTVTLPPVANAGFRAKFITGAAFDTSNFVVASAEGDNMEGSLIVAGAVVDCDAADQINFVSTAENIGDFVEVFSDGTYWHVFGNALTTGGLTATG